MPKTDFFFYWLKKKLARIKFEKKKKTVRINSICDLS